MPWSTEAALNKLWSELDKNATNSKVRALLKRHLEAAYDAGVRRQRKAEEARWRDIAIAGAALLLSGSEK